MKFNNQEKWLITGVAGFIGSNLLNVLLKNGQSVVGVDNFSTSNKDTFQLFLNKFEFKEINKFNFYEVDIRNFSDLDRVFKENKNIKYVLHQAAIGSVPRSFETPKFTNENNVDGFLNVLIASKDNNVSKFVFASSSSVYGDNKDDIKTESRIGNQLSPYAVSKYSNELYSSVLSGTGGSKLQSVGLRYFNVFGPMQNPNGPYAAVIPKWIGEMLNGFETSINGDGSITRDYCYVDNVIDANLRAAMTELNQNSSIVNIAVGETTSLSELNSLIARYIEHYAMIKPLKAKFSPPRIGDILHSRADIKKAEELLGYVPKYKIEEGISKTIKWYLDNTC